MTKRIAFLGIDLGTTGLRSILTDEKGSVLSVKSTGVEDSFVQSQNEKISEQDPKFWEPALFNVLKQILPEAKKYSLKAVSVDSTSGTIIPVDRDRKPMCNAFLHNDIRAQDESELICRETNLSVKPSFALSKILWIKNHRPELFDKTYKFLHAADYIKGLISGEFETTDFSNAVKTGYDLLQYRWPDSIGSVLGIPTEKLPDVVKTGEITGELKRSICEEFGIKNKVLVVAGATDSTTSFYSSGAKCTGDWNTTLGTVLGIRGVSDNFIKDPDGLLYAHRHPEGYWLPGAASNTGGESLRLFFGHALKDYDKKIENIPPTGSLIYPLIRRSEKFPFLNLNITGFINMDVCEPVSMFKGFLEGLSFVERMIYDRIVETGYAVGERIFSMGGGAYSTPWLKIRASILKKNIYRAKVVETAFGASIIAAGGAHYRNLTEAIDNMVSIDCKMEPEEKLSGIYDEIYEKFISECRKRNFF